jgi:hypothetical protein
MTDQHENSEHSGEAPDGIGHRPAEPGQGPKYYIDIEGEIYSWDDDEITVQEIRELGDLPEEKGVIEIDLRTQEQRTLGDNETVELHPGRGFSEKFQYKRGRSCRG